MVNNFLVKNEGDIETRICSFLKFSHLLMEKTGPEANSIKKGILMEFLAQYYATKRVILENHL